MHINNNTAFQRRPCQATPCSLSQMNCIVMMVFLASFTGFLKKDICGLDVFLVSIGFWMEDHQVSSGLFDVGWSIGTLLRVMDSVS